MALRLTAQYIEVAVSGAAIKGFRVEAQNVEVGGNVAAGVVRLDNMYVEVVRKSEHRGLTGVLGTIQSGLATDTFQLGAGAEKDLGVFNETASNAIALTQLADEASISREAESTIVLTGQATNNRFPVFATSALVLGQADNVAGPKSGSASSPIALTSVADAVLDTLGRVASSTLVLTQTAASSIKNVLAVTPEIGGLTDGWLQDGYLAQDLDVAAESTLALTQTLPSPTGIRSVFAESPISLLDLGDTDVKTRAPSNTLVMSDQADVEKLTLASSTITLTDSAINGLINLAAENFLVFVQNAQPGPIPRDAESTLFLSDAAGSSIKHLDAESTILVTQDINVLRPYRVDVENKISGITDDIFIPPIGPIIPGVPFGMSDEATVTTNPVRGPLTLIQVANLAEVIHLKVDAVDLLATSLIGFSQLANLSVTADAADTLALADLAIANLNTTDLFSTLDTLADASTFTVSRAQTPAETTLDLKQSVVFSLVRDTTDCDYTPFVGSSDANTTPPPTELPTGLTPPLDPSVRFRLVFPPFDTGATVDTLDLRAPSLGNRERLEVTRISRNTVGGTLTVFADPIWPQVHSLQMTFSALKTDQARGLLDFMERWLGREIGIYDYEGRIWRGVITNPDEAVVNDGKNRYSVSLDIEAERVNQLNEIAQTNLGLADEAIEGTFALSTVAVAQDADYEFVPVAEAVSAIDISSPADYTIVPSANGVSTLGLTAFASRNNLLVGSAESPIALSQIGADLDFDDFGNLIHNWDAENTTGLDGTSLSTWADLGSDPVTLSAAIGEEPLVQDAILNGRRIVEFRHGGGIQRMTSDSNVPFFDLINNVGTIFIVTIVREVLAAGNEIVIGNNNDKVSFGGATSTLRPVILQTSATNAALETPQSVLGNNTNQLLMIRRDNNNVTFRRNKTAKAGTTLSGNPTPADEVLFVGGFSAAANSVDQDIAQILIYDDILSDPDILTIEGLLAAKWGV